jgi:hypothetical protein
LTKFEGEYYNADTTTKYIFPILSKNKTNPTQLEYRKENAYAKQ